ncbi:MAG TPA: hypothetical protein DEB39_16065 [Planctomycetaceae bacterium]|nr:hypothetical protein [Planctomycetaceae bacterium]
MEQQITRELETISRENGFRILYACESGSRAWGFPSPDSDFDIRFLYAHPLDWYLSIEDHRDTFETMLPNDHDISGWELRKALRLFSAGNLGLFEQLHSPIVYVRDEAFHHRLLGMIPAFFQPKRSLYAYLKMAQQHVPQEDARDRMGIKRFFYVLRPLLACEWILANRSMPPTEFRQLLDADLLAPGLARELLDIIQLKAETLEKSLLHPSVAMFDWIGEAIPRIREAVETIDRPTSPGPVEKLNAFFRDTIQ